MVMAALQAAAVLASPWKVAVIVLCFAAGFSIAAIVTVLFEDPAVHAPADRRTELFVWASTSLFAGDALGAAVSGLSIDLIGWSGVGILAATLFVTCGAGAGSTRNTAAGPATAIL